MIGQSDKTEGIRDNGSGLQRSPFCRDVISIRERGRHIAICGIAEVGPDHG